MENLLSSLSVTVFVGILALLAQWSRKSRRAEISLWVVVVFLSLLSLATGALLGAVTFTGQVPTEVYPPGLLVVTAGAVKVGVAPAGVAGLGCAGMLRRPPSPPHWTSR